MKTKKLTLDETIYSLIELPDEAKILDLGCRDAGYLSGIISAKPGKVIKAVGVDVTDKKFNSLPYSWPIELKLMNCDKKFDFPDNEFDLVFSKNLLECIRDKKSFIDEIHRVLKPSGMVVCVHTDFDSIIYNGENKDLITKAVHAYAVTEQGWMNDSDSWMGRRLYGHFNNSGLFEGDISVYNVIETQYTEGSLGYNFSKDIEFLTKESVGVLKNEEYAEFINELIKANDSGTYFYSKPYYIYTGYKKV